MKSYRLLIFEALSQRRRGWLLWSCLLAAVLTTFSFLLPLARGLPYELLAITFLLAGAWAYYAFWFPQATVELQSKFLCLRGPLLPLNISYGRIVSAVPAHTRSVSDLDPALAQLDQQGYLLVTLTDYPRPYWWRRFTFPNLLFQSNHPGLLLHVADCAGLLRAIQEARERWFWQQGETSQRTTEGGAVRERPGRPAKTTNLSPPGPASPLILVVEDNEDTRYFLKALLGPYYRLEMAKDGEEGLEKVRAVQPDLVMTDLVMPRLSGQELLSHIRQDPMLRPIPVICITALSGSAARLESLDAGADDYLTKPFQERELLARVRNLLNARAQERELAELNRLLEAKVEEQMAALVRSGELRRFLPQRVAESVLNGKIEATADFERRIVTILFVDLVGFTALAGQLQPRELASMLNEYLREMAAIAFVHGGTVDKFLGDAVMVMYGAPQPAPPRSQALGAVQSAIAMRRQVRELAGRWRRELPGDVKVRIGINTGECTIGVFGSDLLRSYTAIGPAVNIASRLQSQAAADSILCGTSTYDLVAGEVEAQATGPLQLRGIAQPVPAYQILGFAPTAPLPAGLAYGVEVK
jgi:class 3 adenylate cyclase/CheY-like chemotaxis protein